MTTNDTSSSHTSQPTQRPDASNKSFFTIPQPVKHLFDKFPLYTYPACSRPLRSPRNRNRHVLHVFSSPTDASAGRPSLNPSCCKWQTFLHFQGIKFDTVPSSNHASPSGALPFLIPANAEVPVVASEFREWASSRKGTDEGNAKSEKRQEDAVLKTFESLLSGPIRVAYLAALYFDQTTYTSFTAPQYTHTSRSPAVQYALSLPLRSAALSEVLSESNRDGAENVHAAVDNETLALEAEEAFKALSLQLGEGEWFSEDGMLDAAVFSYTHVLLTIAEQRKEVGVLVRRICKAVRDRKNLVRHRARILEQYYT